MGFYAGWLAARDVPTWRDDAHLDLKPYEMDRMTGYAALQGYGYDGAFGGCLALTLMGGIKIAGVVAAVALVLVFLANPATDSPMPEHAWLFEYKWWAFVTLGLAGYVIST